MRIPCCLSVFALGACSSSEPPVPSPVYYGEVDAILAENCVDCHAADEDRLAPFSLAGYDDAVLAAEHTPIAFAVMNRIMPPYYADDSGACRTYHGNRWLTDAQISTLVAWANGAHAAGDPADATPPPPPPPALDGVEAWLDPGADYLPTQSVDDEYRCFVVDPGLAADQFLTGFQVRPGNGSVVHHVIVFALPDAAAEADALGRDAGDLALGYPCPGGPGPASASFLIGWAPGNAAVRFPIGTGIRMLGGRRVVMQVHYNLAESDRRVDRTTVDLALAAAVADEAAILSVRADVDLLPGQPDVAAIGARALPPGAGGRIWGVAMHMHQRGIGGGVRRVVGGDACLLDLVNWSFHWQHLYWFDTPQPVAGGDRLEVTCHYDTSDDRTPVRWGEGTGDEMCLAYVYASQ